MAVEYKSFTGQLDADGEGSIVAEFSRFDERDAVGDVTLSSFFVPGQAVPMVHDHDWSTVLGKGVIDVQAKSAWFNGRLFLDTIAGAEAYKRLQNLGDLAQYSYGYLATDTERGQLGGKSVRYLKHGQTFEVSDTLVGAMPGTRTVSLKSRKGLYVSEPPEGSYEDVAEDIEEAMTEQGFAPAGAYVSVIATFPTYAYVCVCTGGDDDTPMGEPTYWRVDYTLNADGDPVLSNPTEVEPGVVFTPTDEPGLTFASQSAKALAAVERLAVRTSALVALRQRSERKSGRVLSAANHAKLSAVHDGIAGHLAAMADVLKAHAPTPPTDGAKAAAPEQLDPRRLWAEFLHLEAKRNGV